MELNSANHNAKEAEKLMLPVYRELRSGQPVDAIRHTTIIRSSERLGWEGFQLDVARTHGWHVDDLMVDGHLLCLNLNDCDVVYSIRNESDWTTVRLTPGSFWIHPEGKPFSIVHDEKAYYASIFINGAYLDGLSGQHIELQGGNGVQDEVMAALTRSLIALLYDEDSYSPELAEKLLRAFVFALVNRHGRPESAYIKGGIAPAQLKALTNWINNNLNGLLTVKAMAGRVGLSAAHFSREFKRSTGCTPWEYVVQVRLDVARQLLEAGESISETALRLGFSDQSHLSRLFKQKYGMTPSSFAKAHRGWYAT